MAAYKHIQVAWISFICICLACGTPPKNKEPVQLSDPQITVNRDTLALASYTRYYDKVLGGLVGSAIGDAMGASTEMWARKDIYDEYGYINGLTPLRRTRSPEGPWAHYLDSGGTTDDTRWKYLMGQYFAQHQSVLSARHFAKFITDYYQSEAKKLRKTPILNDPKRLDGPLQRIDWIKEWAIVAFAYQDGQDQYAQAQSMFYGGEMSCAGLLYTPMFGLIAPNAEAAYTLAFAHSLFDIGYAKDIAATAAAMTSLALTKDSLNAVLRGVARIDPFGYMNSRLIGRLSANIAKDSRESVRLARAIEDTLQIPPPQYPGTPVEWAQQQAVYQYLAAHQKAIAFHAGEIWEITYTALYFGQGDFRKTMAFIVNYGRDNDTVAAIAGMVLGTYLGYAALPEDLKTTVVSVSKNTMGIDLAQLATKIAKVRYPDGS